MSHVIRSMEKLVLIDGNALIHRAFHAIKPLSTRNGELVNAVYGFTSMLFTVITQEQPKYLICTFDAAKKTFRHEQYEEYKATRTKAPDELYEQIPRIHEIVDTLEIPKFILEGYEADDLIGTIANKAEKIDEISKTIIVTGDMDALQLVTEKTCVSNLHKGYKETKCFNPKDVYEKYGIHPNQVIEYKGLVGDTSDNIPGVHGVGDKSAVKLLQTYKNLEGIYKNIGDIKGSLKDKLETDKENAFFSRELATIKKDIPLDFKLEDARTHDFDTAKVLTLFESLQFYSLMRRIQEWKKSSLTKEEEKLLEELANPSEKKSASLKEKKENKEQLSMF